MSGRQRSIQLDQQDTPSVFDWYSIKELPNNGYCKRWRIGTRLFIETVEYATPRSDDPDYYRETRIVEERSAIVEFVNIFRRCEVEEDDDCGRPWDNCDGYGHSFLDPEEVHGISPTISYQDIKRMSGYVKNTYNSNEGVIQLHTTCSNQTPWTYWHERGASKQVARQMAAAERAMIMAQLVEWYEQGWQYYYVTCDYRGYRESLCGIDDLEYARQCVTKDLAAEVAHDMLEDGWLVEGLPEPVPLKWGRSMEDWKKHYQRHLNSQNMKEI